MHLIHTMAYGGVESVVLNWLGKIDRERFDVRLVCFANPGETEAPFVREAAQRGFIVAKIPWNRRKPLLKSAYALKRLMQEHQTEILHMHNEYANFVGALATLLQPVKTISTIYVRGDFSWRRNILQTIDGLVIRCFDRVTAHCEMTRKQLAESLGAKDIKTLICGFESEHNEAMQGPEERLARRNQAGIKDGETLLVNVARLYPEKHQAFLLESFAEIVEKCPKARLWIVGVGPLEAELKSYATQLGVTDRVEFLGWVENWQSLLPLCDIQVHPALMEGVSLAIGEGMAAGLPVIASDVGGLREVLTHKRTGILVPSGDKPRFVEETVRLILNKDERLRLGSAAQRFINSEYSLGLAVRSLEETYSEVLGCHVSVSS
jgi:glycosyltransferase involved in cell wall biosynthesis